jgi:hypothetical protein
VQHYCNDNRYLLLVIGKNLISAGQEMTSLASLIQALPNNDNAVGIGKEAAQQRPVRIYARRQ